MKIVIEAMHGMGDVVCMLPMIRELQEAYHKMHLTIVINRDYIAEVLKSSGIQFDKVIAVNAHTELRAFLRTCCQLRQEHFDISISSPNTSVRKAKMMMLLVAPSKKLGMQFTKGIYFADLNDKYHFVEANLLQLEQFLIPNHHFRPQLLPNPEIVNYLKKAISTNGPIIGVCVGRGDKMRKPPIYTRGWGDIDEHIVKMKALINLLIEKKWHVILIGGFQEIEIASKLMTEFPQKEQITDFVGKSTVSESIALTSICNVVFGVDTGMMHVADAVGTATVSLFGPTNPKTHGAYSEKAIFVESDNECKNCYGTSMYINCRDRKCLKDVTPEMVFRSIQSAVKE